MPEPSLSSTLISCYELVSSLEKLSLDEDIEFPFIVEELKNNLAIHITYYFSCESWSMEPDERKNIPFSKNQLMNE